MPILPVLDLKHGKVVRGVAGRRDEYRPIVSMLTPSAEPRDVARALHEEFGFTEFYVADLDAIGGAAPARPVFAALHACGFRLWADAGIREHADARTLATMSVAQLVVGLETVRGPDSLREICQEHGPDRIVFSLDLKDGQPLCSPARWGISGAWEIAQRVLGVGVSRMLLLDLARVGGGSGVGTEELCHRLRQAHPELELSAGGGVRDVDDVHRLVAQGVKHVLVASALHDGRITRKDVEALADHQR
jgi:phosphoribosylformimino-5-aminoimidazole carboxamide ribotide isomerase